MSLLRVTSYGSLSPERGRRSSDAHGPRDRKLSFSPLPGSWDPLAAAQEAAQPIGAFEVPKFRRIRKFYTLSPRFPCKFD